MSDKEVVEHEYHLLDEEDDLDDDVFFRTDLDMHALDNDVTFPSFISRNIETSPPRTIMSPPKKPLPLRPIQQIQQIPLQRFQPPSPSIRENPYFNQYRQHMTPHPVPIQPIQFPVTENTHEIIRFDTSVKLHKRKRRDKCVKSACTNCKASHHSCSGKIPCDRCVKKKIEDTCVMSVGKKRGRKRVRVVTPSSVEEVEKVVPKKKKRKKTIIEKTKKSEEVMPDGVSMRNTKSMFFGLRKNSEIGVLVMINHYIIVSWNATIRNWLGYKNEDLFDKVKQIEDISYNAGDIVKLIGECVEEKKGCLKDLKFSLKDCSRIPIEVEANVVVHFDRTTMEIMLMTLFVRKINKVNHVKTIQKSDGTRLVVQKLI